MKRRIGVAVLGLFVVVSSLASIPATAAGLDIEDRGGQVGRPCKPAVRVAA